MGWSRNVSYMNMIIAGEFMTIIVSIPAFILFTTSRAWKRPRRWSHSENNTKIAKYHPHYWQKKCGQLHVIVNLCIFFHCFSLMLSLCSTSYFHCIQCLSIYQWHTVCVEVCDRCIYISLGCFLYTWTWLSWKCRHAEFIVLKIIFGQSSTPSNLTSSINTSSLVRSERIIEELTHWCARWSTLSTLTPLSNWLAFWLVSFHMTYFVAHA